MHRTVVKAPSLAATKAAASATLRPHLCRLFGVRLFSSRPVPKANASPDDADVPGCWRRRLDVWRTEATRQGLDDDALAVAANAATTRGVRVDGAVYQAVPGRTTALHLAREYKLKYENSALLALRAGQPWDLTRPLFDDVQDPAEASSALELGFCAFDHEEGIRAFWHSSAHVLGQALELHFGCAANTEVFLDDGPALRPDLSAGLLNGGFFYDVFLRGGSDAVSTDDFPALAQLIRAISKAKQPFERMEVSAQVARAMFADNPLKLAVLDRLARDAVNVPVTAYKCGAFIDLCRGPHLAHTGRIKAMELLKSSAALITSPPAALNPGAAESLSVQRVTGISFPNNADLKGWKQRVEDAEKRDHRVIGKAQGLFMFHRTSPGVPFFLPNGTHVYNALVALLREAYLRHGYEEVRSPLVYSQDLFETSGHWHHYRKNMFVVDAHRNVDTATAKPAPDAAAGAFAGADSAAACNDDTSPSAAPSLLALKPMNCPGHCLIYKNQLMSFRDLPQRYADFSDLHRREESGSLSGLMRVQRFAQDDAHIFCTPEQLAVEIQGCLTFIRDIYATLGFDATKLEFALSTRPEKALAGQDGSWTHAEAVLARELTAFLGSSDAWTTKAGDGAFYGPKIDVGVRDAMHRLHQCATLQLDFNLPNRFGLVYTDADGSRKTPVMVHRAALGSLERLMAILIEHTGGRWPLWLSPHQVYVCSVHASATEYAEAVAAQVRAAGLRCGLGSPKETLKKQVRLAQTLQYNYILVVGAKEMETGTVTVRRRDGSIEASPPSVDAFLARARQEVQERCTQPPKDTE